MSLFTDLPLDPKGGWTVTGTMLGRNHEWTHKTGIQVRHCGHPTALRPYYVVGYLNTVGTFRLLAEAKAAAESLLVEEAL